MTLELRRTTDDRGPARTTAARLGQRSSVLRRLKSHLEFKGPGNPLARRLHKRVAADRWEVGLAELLRRARGNSKVLETNESELR